MLFKSLLNEGIIFLNPDTSINIFTLTNNINLTGIPTAPTAEPGTDSNLIATTEFVLDALSVQNITEYQDTSFVAVGDTYDQAISKLIKIIEDDECVTAAAINDLNDKKLDTSAVLELLEPYVNDAAYDSSTKRIYFKHDDTVISSIDATDFIKDGMINDVSIIDSSMVITFNTDAGKEDITLNMHQIFDPSIYYTKNEIDTNFVVNASIQNINKVPYVSETPAANVTIEPYKMYDFGTVSTTMNIAFDTTKEVSGYTKEYIIRLTAESGCSVVLPNTVLYANRNIPNYTAGHIYEITIVNNCAVVAEFY